MNGDLLGFRWFLNWFAKFFTLYGLAINGIPLYACIIFGFVIGAVIKFLLGRR